MVKNDKLGLAMEIRRYRIRRLLKSTGLSLVIGVGAFLIMRLWFLNLADPRELGAGRVLSVQIVETDGKREMWVFWGERGHIKIERRPIDSSGQGNGQ